MTSGANDIAEKEFAGICPDRASAYCVLRNNRQLSQRRSERMNIALDCAGEWRSAFSPRSPSGDVR
jgi:hypothetical protein